MAEKEYIEREAAIFEFETNGSNFVYGQKACNAIISRLKTIPAADVVEVVRCIECKHRPIKPDDYNPITTDGFALEFPDEKCPCQCGDRWYSKYPDDDWYCADGERKGGDE